MSIFFGISSFRCVLAIYGMRILFAVWKKCRGKRMGRGEEGLESELDDENEVNEEKEGGKSI